MQVKINIRNEKGATVVEVALMFCLALLFVFGFMQIAFIETVHSIVSYASFISARSSAVGLDGYGHPQAAASDIVKGIFSGERRSPSVSSGGGTSVVGYGMDIIFPFVRTFLGSEWQLRSTISLPREPTEGFTGDNDIGPP